MTTNLKIIVPRFDAAARHLLRHLDDPRALRRNPLVGWRFANIGRASAAATDREVLNAIRKSVAAHAEMLDHGQGTFDAAKFRRHREIITRCDVRGEPHALVAAALGLSRRQFYRERRRARLRLADLLWRDIPAGPAGVTEVPSEFEMRLAYVETLKAVGKFGEASDALRRVAADLRDPAARCIAWCRYADIQCDAGIIDAARAALDDARSALAQAESLGTATPVLLGEIQLVDAVVAWRVGKVDTARELSQRIIAELEPMADPLHERTIELVASAHLELGSFARERGDVETALDHLETARGVLERMREQSPSLRVRLLQDFAAAHGLVIGAIGLARRENAEAFAIARRHGLVRDAARTSVTLCSIHQQQGELPESLAYGRGGLAIARSVAGADELSYYLLIVSYAESLVGNGRVALSHIDEARARATRGGFVWALSMVAEGEALLGLRAYASAVRVANRARTAMQALGAERLVGTCLRIAAEAHEAMGERPLAIASIKEALTILESYGHAYTRAQALACSARLTGNRRHRGLALELTKSLRG